MKSTAEEIRERRLLHALLDEYELLGIDKIEIPETARPYNAAGVHELVQSIKATGLQVPITVDRAYDEDDDELHYRLISGRHRLEAYRVLGREKIPARVVTLSDIEQRLWTISENLHRTELTVAERSSQIAEWIRLTEAKAAEKSASQVEPKLKTDSNPKGAGRAESGISAAARELGIDRNEAQRAVKIDSITPAAKEALRSAKLDDNQSVALKVASYADADQVEAVATIAAAKAKPKVAYLAEERFKREQRPAPQLAAVPEAVDDETPEQTDRRIFLSFAADTVEAARIALEELAETQVKSEDYFWEMIVATNGVFRAWERIRNRLEDLEAAASGGDDTAEGDADGAP